MAGFEITNISMTKKNVALRDSVSLTVTLKNTNSKKSKLTEIFQCYLYLPDVLWNDGKLPVSFYADGRGTLGKKTSIAYNKSASFTFTFDIVSTSADESDIDWVALVNALNADPAVRAFPLRLYITAGYANGNYDDVSESIPNAHIIRSYLKPSVLDFDLERANEDGDPDDEGKYVRSTLVLAMADESEADNMQLYLYCEGETDGAKESRTYNLTRRIPELLAGVRGDPDLIKTDYGARAEFDEGSDWDFTLVFGDQYESTQVPLELPRSFANLHLSGCETGGACFGGFGESTEGAPLLESYYPIYAHAGIYGVTNHVAGEIKPGGLWIDNKPNYINRIAATITAGSTVKVATLPDAIDVLHHISGTFVGSDGKVRTIPFAYYGDASWNVACNVDKNTGEVVLRMGSSYSGNYDVNLHLEYTKVNDEIVDTETHERLVDISNYTLTDKDGKTLMARREK